MESVCAHIHKQPWWEAKGLGKRLCQLPESVFQARHFPNNNCKYLALPLFYKGVPGVCVWGDFGYQKG